MLISNSATDEWYVLLFISFWKIWLIGAKHYENSKLLKLSPQWFWPLFVDTMYNLNVQRFFIELIKYFENVLCLHFVFSHKRKLTQDRNVKCFLCTEVIAMFAIFCNVLLCLSNKLSTSRKVYRFTSYCCVCFPIGADFHTVPLNPLTANPVKALHFAILV